MSMLFVVKSPCVRIFYALGTKEISVAEAAADEITDENGNKGIRLLQNVKNMFSDAYTNMEYGSVLFLIDNGLYPLKADL